MILHFVYEGDETGEGGERTVLLSIFGEFLPCWKNNRDVYLIGKAVGRDLLNQ